MSAIFVWKKSHAKLLPFSRPIVKKLSALQWLPLPAGALASLIIMFEIYRISLPRQDLPDLIVDCRPAN
jgi:hypothetical protein